MGDDEHLRRPRQAGEPAAHLDRRAAADAGVDLVEHEARHVVDPGEHDLEGEHDPGQLAAGGASVQRPCRGTAVRDQLELDVVDARRSRTRSSHRR